MKEIEIVAPSGQRGFVPDDQLESAIAQGARLVTPEEREEDRKEATYGDRPLVAAMLGGARGLSLGLSDYALEKTGTFSAEELKEIKDRNAPASNVAELVTTVAPAVLTGGGSLAAKIATKAPALAGLAAATPAGAVAGLAARTGSKVAQEVAKRVVAAPVLTTAAELGAAGAIEGALYNAGKLISEDALGDAEFSAEALVSNLGLGAVAGGGIGAGLGALSATVSKALRKRDINKQIELVKKSVDDPEIQKVAIQQIKDERLTDDTVNLLMKNSSSLEKDAELISRYAGQELNPTPGMKSGSPLIQDQEATIAALTNTPGGLKVRAELDAIADTIEQSLKKATGDVGTSEYQLGKRFKERFLNRLDQETKPLADVFEATDTMFKDIDVSDFQKKINLTNIKNNASYQNASKEVRQYIDGIADQYSRSKTFGQIKALRQVVGEDVGNLSRAKTMGNLRAGEGAILNAMGDVYSALTRIEETALDKAARKYFKNVPDLAQWKSNYSQAKKEWSKIIEKYVPVVEDLNLGKGKIGIANLKKKLELLDEEKLAKRFGSAEAFEKFQTLSKDFNDIVEEKQAFELANILAKSYDETGSFNPKMFRNRIKNIKNEKREALFGKNLELVGAIERTAQTITLPRNVNPSGSGFIASLIDTISPIYQAKEAARYALYRKGAEGYRKFFAKGLPDLITAKQVADRSRSQIQSSARGFFKSTGRAINYGAAEQMNENQIKRAEQTLQLFNENPEEFFNRMILENKDLQTYMPKVNQAAQNRVIASVQFLSEKFPRRPEYVMQDDYEPPKSEITKFNDYLFAIEKPLKAIEQLKYGYINPRAIETLKVVYPKMFAQLQQDLIENMPKKLTPSQRNQLYLILGSRTTPIASPQAMALLQGAAAQEIPTNKVPVSATKEMNSAGRVQSDFDRVANRRA